MVTIYLLIGINVFLALAIIHQQNIINENEKMHKQEREGLYNRIMAKDLNEYAMAQQPQQKRSPGGNMIKDIEDLKNQGFVK